MGTRFRYYGVVYKMTDPHTAYFKDEDRTIVCDLDGEICKAEVPTLGGIDYGDDLYHVTHRNGMSSFTTAPICEWCSHDLLRGDNDMICPDCGEKFELNKGAK